ncbi:glycosyltransferase family 2 protein [Xinfangfangia sp. CPCC 101601]|uniref:Glycosyltransferase family 2 protein n=1 Tax=Pseudogemmobacter lacusdianii TaxID=3069608 RepID=A0ABU0VWV9_9RHOB|nr:glycosyltransferase family 2 protein [Xinfangfangia sp. CPCC 101601]MDQ2066244.1 glycosyltransferase family 2 protein [Xinfangfangia sp. CPCC 101601]
MLSLIIPASNEEAWLGACLAAVAGSEPVPGGFEVIVVANGCRDATAEVARGFKGRLPGLQVLELAEGSKPLALTAGDRAACGAVRVYLDADCVISPSVLAALARVLDRREPLYGGATPVIPRAKSSLTRAYARFWQELPFARSVAPGYGLYAVNAAGRARWGDFPQIISDDSFVRLQFLPEERVQVSDSYLWPMVEGFSALVRTRRRQDRGVAELAALQPELIAREGKARLGLPALGRLALRDPLGFAAYAAVSVAVRLKRGAAGFTRGR